MSALYLDTCALVKAYVSERGSETMEQVLTRPPFLGGLFVGRHMQAEMLCALSGKWRRKEITSRREYLKALASFRGHYPALFNVQDIWMTLYDTAAAYAAKYPARKIGAADYLHIAVAEHIADLLGGALHVVTSDGGVKWLAKKRGFDVLDPELHDIAAFERAALPLFS